VTKDYDSDEDESALLEEIERLKKEREKRRLERQLEREQIEKEANEEDDPLVDAHLRLNNISSVPSHYDITRMDLRDEVIMASLLILQSKLRKK